MKRTHNNGELRLTNVGETVTLIGWVAKKRNMGAIAFVDLRDRYGLTQCVFGEAFNDTIKDVKNEYILQVTGKVVERSSKNPKMPTGDIEIEVQDVKVINKAKQPPIIVADDTDASEEVRMKYRYLDLRRPVLQNKIITRAKIVKSIHEFLDSENFIEIETPYLGKSTPEGARDFLVPSRVHNGEFYALPQSPQLFKQLLMVSGFERYYQIARCFRDEDLRADRQPEFTQVDVEMSFMDTDQILDIGERLVAKIMKDVKGIDLQLPLRRMTWHDAMETYGIDKPDTRFEIKLREVKDIFAKSEFGGFKDVEAIKAIVVPNVSDKTSRKVIDELTLEAKKFGLGGLTVLKKENGELTGSFVKFLSEAEIKALNERLGLVDNDILIIGAGNDNRVTPLLGALRLKYGRELGLIKEGTFDLLWVIDFPMFERDVESGAIVATHHPFTRPRDEDVKYLDTDPTKVLSYAYDIVINGYEAGGGTLRIYNQDMQRKIFEILGLKDEEIKERFGYFVDALQYGTPPHAGMAFGLDRLAMILGGTDNIRDVIAFPKNLAAVDPMTNAPTNVTQAQLDELGIKFDN